MTKINFYLHSRPEPEKEPQGAIYNSTQVRGLRSGLGTYTQYRLHVVAQTTDQSDLRPATMARQVRTPPIGYGGTSGCYGLHTGVQ
jgi:hypothetical protein